MAHQIEQAHLTGLIEVDSAGTGDWHIGAKPDHRAVAEAAARGIAMKSRARQIQADDFSRFNLILAMDSDNLRDLRAIAPNGDAMTKIHLLREFESQGDIATAGHKSWPGQRISSPDISGLEISGLDVPDPYYGGPEGFRLVFDLVERACVGLLNHVSQELLHKHA